jgi:hemerythrin-like domain-containing protein
MVDNSAAVRRPSGFKMDGFLAIHKAMQKDISALDQAVQQVDVNQPDQVARLERWFHFYWDMVVVHHQTEDSSFFPILVQRDPAFGEKMKALGVEHQELHDLVDRIEQTFKQLLEASNSSTPNQRQLVGGQLAELTTRLREKLVAHLRTEEEAMLPVVAAQLSEKEQQDFEKKLQRTTPRQHIALALPWILSALDDTEFRKVYSSLPLPLRLFYRLSWKKKYQDLISVFQSRA